MPRNYIIASVIILVIVVSGLFFFGNDGTFSSLPGINLANIFGPADLPAEVVMEEGNSSTIDPHYDLASPANFKVSTIQGDGYILTTYEKNSKEGFQVFVMPFDEPGPLTHERILIDLDIDMTNPALIVLDGVEAPIFNSSDENFGKTFEVWFIHKNKLYQIMTYAAYEEQLLKILETWRFES